MSKASTAALAMAVSAGCAPTKTAENPAPPSLMERVTQTRALRRPLAAAHDGASASVPSDPAPNPRVSR